MDGLHIVVVVFIGVVSCSHDQSSASVLEVTVRPGDNITLYCDCKLSAGVFIVWYRNCSHENQPSLVLKANGPWDKIGDVVAYLTDFPRFHFVSNDSSDSYDLRIMNITDSDEGLYYCGTEEKKVEYKEHENKITSRYIYSNGNITLRITVNVTDDTDSSYPDCVSHRVTVGSWMMMVFPTALAILSASFNCLLVFCLCQKKEKEAQVLDRFDISERTRWNQDGDMCFTHVVFRAKDEQRH